MSEHRNWKIIYSEYRMMQKKAIELVYRTVGSQLLRDAGVYAFYTLPCETEGSELRENAIVIGLYENISLIRKYINRDEIPCGGYLVKCFDNPDHPENKIVIITGDTDKEVFYGAVDFVEDYFIKAAVKRAALTYTEKLFTMHLPDYTHASAPKIKTRSVFTWGHPINDYREYIDNMAMLKLNQLVIWNDFVPLNANDIVEYAHEYGIEVIWGYAWGWSRNCLGADVNSLEKLKEQIVDEYEENYRDISADGIYFQSFTETSEEKINGRLIADAVVELVNMTAAELLSRHPKLKLQFGLHAVSVKDHLEYFKNVDKRVEIVWEDCGAFPFNYEVVCTDEAFKSTCKFIDDAIRIRDAAPIGMYYKGQLTNDWTDWDGGCFAHQAGRYICGMDSEETKLQDAQTVRPLWRILQRDWLIHGKKAYDMTNRILDATHGDINLGIAGQLSGKIWFSVALCAQILWDPTQPYEELADSVSKRRDIFMD